MFLHLDYFLNDPIVIPESADNLRHSDKKRLAPPLDLLEFLEGSLLKSIILTSSKISYNHVQSPTCPGCSTILDVLSSTNVSLLKSIPSAPPSVNPSLNSMPSISAP